MNSDLTPAAAGKLVGKSKGTIIKAIHDGRLSAARDERGAFTIAPVELFRVFAPLNGNGHTKMNADEQGVNTPSTEGLQVEVKLLREMLAAANDQVDFLRERLEGEQAERMRLTALLTIERPPTPQVEPAKAKANWWQRLLGG